MENPGEDDVTSLIDNDGNGYAGDVYGYNFVSGNGYISWSEAADTGHGTHVAGTIAAVNNNGIGVSGIAGGDGTDNSGVKIMSCQLFSGDKGVTLLLRLKLSNMRQITVLLFCNVAGDITPDVPTP